VLRAGSVTHEIERGPSHRGEPALPNFRVPCQTFGLRFKGSAFMSPNPGAYLRGEGRGAARHRLRDRRKVRTSRQSRGNVPGE